jgi:hypothetical protein
MRTFVLVGSSLWLAVLGGGCASPGRPVDAGPGARDAAGLDAPELRPECDSESRLCPSGFVCAAVDSVPRCVPDPDPPPPGDGTRCGACPAPGECRMGVCIQPSPTGEVCEFDDACTSGQLCIAGRCTPDPRLPVPCTDPTMCPAGFLCVDGVCACAFSADCPIGLECLAGACVPGPGGACIADADCPSTRVCEAGMCVERGVCDIESPNLSGTWSMNSSLRFREALPSGLSAFLDFIEGPFRFLGGETTCIDFGLPSWVETAICDLVAPYVDMYLPPWSRPVFRAIADLNSVLTTWNVDETMVLMPGAVSGSYRGTHTWNRVTFMYRDSPLTADPTDILDWRFSPSPFNASAVCGTFSIERHSVNVSIGSVIAWLVDAIIYEVSDGRWSGLSDALAEVVDGFCRGLADAAESAIDYPGVGGTVMGVCSSTLTGLADTAIRELIEARIGADPITLRGTAPITGPSSLRPGRWDGTLLGSDFTGDWSAMR